MIVQESELNGTMKSLIFPHVSPMSQVHSASRSFQTQDLGQVLQYSGKLTFAP
jgi:hypothetical protein